MHFGHNTHACAPACSSGDAASTSEAKVKVVANLPYNITKEFLKAMLPMGAHVSDLHIMIQVGVQRGVHGDSKRVAGVYVAGHCSVAPWVKGQHMGLHVSNVT